MREISLPATDYAIACYYIICTAEASSNLARYDGVRYTTPRPSDPETLIDMYRKTRGEGFGAECKRRIMLGTYVLSAGYYDAYYLKAQKVRALIARDFARAFEQVDAIVDAGLSLPGLQAGREDRRPAGDVPLRHLHHHRVAGRHPLHERAVRHARRPGCPWACRSSRGTSTRRACCAWPTPSSRPAASKAESSAASVPPASAFAVGEQDAIHTTRPALRVRRAGAVHRQDDHGDPPRQAPRRLRRPI